MTRVRRTGFTLVELLTVVAIIALLISILVPAVVRARRSAKEVAIKAQLHGIGQGLEMFNNDFGYYPSSLPQEDANPGVDAVDRAAVSATPADYPIYGTHRLAFALLGRDKLGCPAKAGSGANILAGSNTGPDSLTGWYYSDTGATAFAPGAFNATYENAADGDWGDPSHKTARKGPYIDPEGFTVIADERMGFNGANRDYVWVLCDKYDKNSNSDITADADFVKHSAILYYAPNTRGNQIGNPGDAVDDTNDIYFWEDNEGLVGTNFDDLDASSTDADRDDFWLFIEDESANVGTFKQPHNRESYLLISRGYDGIYGTDDDITNWER